jgi:hypothetical protein
MPGDQMKHKGSAIAAVLLVIALIAAAIVYFYKQPRGTIKLQCPSATLSLKGIFGNFQITSCESASVPVRDYQPKHLVIHAAQDNDTWRISCYGPWGSLSPVKVQKDQTTILEFGPPFKTNPEIHKKWGQISIGLSITGKAGERYFPAIIKNGVELPPPAVKITDEKGNILASGRFEYG